MYENHWGLQKAPFGSDRRPELYFSSSTHQSALLKLRYLVDHRRGAGLLVGPSGSGKTRLLQALLPEGDESGPAVVKVVYPLLTPQELIGFIAAELGIPGQFGIRSLDVLLGLLRGRLQELTRQGRPAVIVIDDAQSIPDRHVFESLHLLLNLQQPPNVDFTLILAGQPDLVGILKRFPQLDDRLSIPCVLTAMTESETAAYVLHCLQAAGAAEPIFSGAALQAIHELSSGLPRRINRLCDFALLVGYAQRLGMIDATQIEAVFAELSLSRAA